MHMQERTCSGHILMVCALGRQCIVTLYVALRTSMRSTCSCLGHCCFAELDFRMHAALVDICFAWRLLSIQVPSRMEEMKRVLFELEPKWLRKFANDFVICTETAWTRCVRDFQELNNRRKTLITTQQKRSRTNSSCNDIYISLNMNFRVGLANRPRICR